MGKISPSILSADFSRLGEEINAVEKAGADYIHIDVMDGLFVPNISIGPLIVKTVKKITSLPLDVHLMIIDPDKYIDEFIDAGSDILTVHVEAATHLHRTITHIKERGIRAGVSLNPSTPLSSLDYILEYVDMVLIMSVNPGFGGQKFIESIIPKIESLRAMIDKNNLETELNVDGGINIDNIENVAAAGATVFVAGSGIYGTTDYKETISLMKDLIRKANQMMA
ncbi:MAG: ribulose-phosphate 3-epimerase [Spirochaetes bacterium]|nr:ribulose-phosphate 3-epimerase [Spirochaetota bacterium]